MAELTNETVENLNSSLQSFNELAKQMQEQLAGGNEELQTSDDNIKKINKGMQKWNKDLKSSDGMLAGMVKKTKEIAATIVSTKLIWSLGEFVHSILESEQSMMRLGIQMGKGRKGGEDLYKTLGRIQNTTGATFEQVKEMTELMASNKFQGNIQEMGSHMLFFSRATGVSVGEAGNLAVNLSRVGGLGDKAIQQITVGMTKVQQRVGISRQGMSALADSIQASAHNMAAMGKSAEDIKLMTQRTTGLVAALEKVGIAASRTLEIVEKLTDPELIEENVAAWAALGISIQDALGGGDITDQVGAGMQEMASKVAAMGPIAGAQYAKAFGMSYKELMKVNQADVMGEMSKTAEDMNSDDPVKMMKDLADLTDTTLGKVDQFVNKIEGAIRTLKPLLIIVGGIILTVILPKLWEGFRNLFAKASVGTQQALENGVAAGAEMGAQKGSDIIKEKMGKAGRGMAAEYAKMMEDSNKQVMGKIAADLIKNQSDYSVLPIKFIGSAAAEFNKNLESGLTLYDLYDKVSNSIAGKQVEGLHILQQEKGMREALIGEQQTELGELLKKKGYSESEVSLLINQSSLTNEQLEKLKEKSGIGDKDVQNMIIQLGKLEEQKNSLDGIYQITERTGMMSKNALEIEAKLRKEAREEAERGGKDLEKGIEELNKQKEIQDNIIKALEDQHQLYQDAYAYAKKGSLEEAQSHQLMVEYNKKIEEAKKEKEELAKTIDKENKKHKESLRLVVQRMNEEKEINDLIEGRKEQTSFQRLGNAIRSAFVVGATAVKRGFSQGVTALKSGLKNTWDNIRKHPIKAAVTGMKALGKIGAAIGVVGIVMKLLGPIIEDLMETLKPVIEVIQKVLGGILKKMVEALLPPLLQLLAALYPIVAKLVGLVGGFLLQAIGTLIKALTFWNKGLSNIGQGIVDAGKALGEMAKDENIKEVTSALESSAKGIKENGIQTKKNTEAIESQNQNEPQTLDVNQQNATFENRGNINTEIQSKPQTVTQAPKPQTQEQRTELKRREEVDEITKIYQQNIKEFIERVYVAIKDGFTSLGISIDNIKLNGNINQFSTYVPGD